MNTTNFNSNKVIHDALEKNRWTRVFEVFVFLVFFAVYQLFAIRK